MGKRTNQKLEKLWKWETICAKCRKFSNFQRKWIHHSDENSSLWLKFINLLKIHHYDENSLMWQIFPVLINILHFVTNSSSLRKFVIMKRIHGCDENSWLWWKLIVVMKIYHLLKIHHHRKFMDVIEIHNFDEDQSV